MRISDWSSDVCSSDLNFRYNLRKIGILCMQALDDADRRILTRLRLHARITNSALAAEVGLSPSAFLRRVRLLEQSGVIRGYPALVSGAAPDTGSTASVPSALWWQTEESTKEQKQIG